MNIKALRLTEHHIKDFRARCGWSQRDLALVLGIQQSQISLWESGRRKCSISRNFLMRMPPGTDRIKHWLIDRGIQQLSIEKRNSLLSGAATDPFFGVLPASYVEHHFDDIFLAIGNQLKCLWIA